ncbi:uncharacterized protein N7515_008456 [Penicillium bovifimosum]|uniref:Retrovirus-related Pol polyprotein from transposon TNT 1-94-like beta-barrel domain-containing protein n=1 Tax=Penicillium bovifimosum TaxID=126998 RepID=A0A9W9KXR3_9EURO|nr:uncharacterized protein N7515_008456 [Penicillium bovifimosum]KAJ5124631.1 hypothetical protein N7515_008456 [Penicillium bovifimosum]
MSAMSELNWLNIPLKWKQDWIPWYTTVKDQATVWDLWEYIDPETPEASLPNIPVKPKIPSVSEITSEAVSVLDLTEKELARYTALTREYDRQNDRFKEYRKNTDKLKQGIRHSVTSEHKRLIVAQPLRTTLQVLKSTYEPNDEERKVQVAENWNKLCSQVPPKSNLDGWILKMQVCYAEAKEVGCQEFEQNERIIIQFLRAVGSTSPEFYGIWMDRIHDPDGRKLPDFPDIINRYSQQVGVAAPRYQHRLAHAATFQGRESDTNNKKKSTCPCESDPNEGDHSFAECPYVNPAVRAAGWEPNEEAEKRFKRATKSKAFKTAYTKALEKFKKDSSSSSSESSTSEKQSRTAAFSTYIPKTVISDITEVALNTMQKKDTAKPPKCDIWCYDTGASVHICNDKSLLSDYRPAAGSVRVGDTQTNILGFGTLKVTPTESFDGIHLALKNSVD